MEISYQEKKKGEEEGKGMRGFGEREREKEGGSNTDGLNFLNILGNCVLFFFPYLIRKLYKVLIRQSRNKMPFQT